MTKVTIELKYSTARLLYHLTGSLSINKLERMEGIKRGRDGLILHKPDQARADDLSNMFVAAAELHRLLKLEGVK